MPASSPSSSSADAGRVVSMTAYVKKSGLAYDVFSTNSVWNSSRLCQGPDGVYVKRTASLPASAWKRWA